MTYMFVYENMKIGGCQLLIEKIAVQTKKSKNNKCIVLCRDIDDSILRKLLLINIEVVYVDKWSQLSSKIREMSREEDEELNICTFTVNDYCNCCSHKSRNKKTLLYAVHDKALILGNKQGNIFEKNIYYYFRKLLIRLEKEKRVVLMDEQTLNTTKKFYEFSEKWTPNIIRISVDTNNVNPISKEMIECNLRQPRILTIARADFPFKGYILGLIRWMSECSNSEIKLTIISYGNDEKQILSCLEQIPPGVKKRIDLIGKTEYEDIDTFIKQSIVYVGMGTTLIDASLRGIISIPVKAYTYDVYADKVFHEDYRVLGLEMDNHSKNLTNIINRILAMSADAYFDISRKNYDLCVTHYSVENNTKKITQQFENEFIDQTKLMVCFFSAYYTIRKKMLEK